eukprot:10172859-Heterocapsa_arctica.AAC.1
MPAAWRPSSTSCGLSYGNFGRPSAPTERSRPPARPLDAFGGPKSPRRSHGSGCLSKEAQANSR